MLRHVGLQDLRGALLRRHVILLFLLLLHRYHPKGQSIIQQICAGALLGNCLEPSLEGLLPGSEVVRLFFDYSFELVQLIICHGGVQMLIEFRGLYWQTLI